MEVMGRRERVHKQLLDDLEESRGYWKYFYFQYPLECVLERGLDRTRWRTRFGRNCGPVVRQNT